MLATGKCLSGTGGGYLCFALLGMQFLFRGPLRNAYGSPTQEVCIAAPLNFHIRYCTCSVCWYGQMRNSSGFCKTGSVCLTSCRPHDISKRAFWRLFYTEFIVSSNLLIKYQHTTGHACSGSFAMDSYFLPSDIMYDTCLSRILGLFLCKAQGGQVVAMVGSLYSHQAAPSLGSMHWWIPGMLRLLGPLQRCSSHRESRRRGNWKMSWGTGNLLGDAPRKVQLHREIVMHRMSNS